MGGASRLPLPGFRCLIIPAAVLLGGADAFRVRVNESAQGHQPNNSSPEKVVPVDAVRAELGAQPANYAFMHESRPSSTKAVPQSSEPHEPTHETKVMPGLQLSTRASALTSLMALVTSLSFSTGHSAGHLACCSEPGKDEDRFQRRAIEAAGILVAMVAVCWVVRLIWSCRDEAQTSSQVPSDAPGQRKARSYSNKSASGMRLAIPGAASAASPASSPRMSSPRGPAAEFKRKKTVAFMVPEDAVAAEDVGAREGCEDISDLAATPSAAEDTSSLYMVRSTPSFEENRARLQKNAGSELQQRLLQRAWQVHQSLTSASSAEPAEQPEPDGEPCTLADSGSSGDLPETGPPMSEQTSIASATSTVGKITTVGGHKRPRGKLTAGCDFELEQRLLRMHERPDLLAAESQQAGHEAFQGDQ